MIKYSGSIEKIKEDIVNLANKPVKVTFNMGRNKIVSFCGMLTGVYPAIFTVTPFDKTFNGRTSYSYSDCLCGKVKLVENEKAE